MIPSQTLIERMNMKRQLASVMLLTINTSVSMDEKASEHNRLLNSIAVATKKKGKKLLLLSLRMRKIIKVTARFIV